MNGKKKRKEAPKTIPIPYADTSHHCSYKSSHSKRRHDALSNTADRIDCSTKKSFKFSVSTYVVLRAKLRERELLKYLWDNIGTF
jgi:hypothetical protein